MKWSFQVRFPPNSSDELPHSGEWRWRHSAKHYDTPEHAAAGAAQLQAIAAINGVILECRLAPIKDVPELPAWEQDHSNDELSKE